MPSAIAPRFQPQRWDATTHRNTLVITMSIVTDMPYAAASPLDDRKPITSALEAIASIQLTGAT
jgi:hypothetical protein